jgi:hypothetical protein
VRIGFACWLIAIALSASSPLLAGSGSQSDPASVLHQIRQVPKNVILIKGAWSSEDDASVPVPENATLTKGTFRDRYFGITYSLPAEWIEKYPGPPPSDSGRYVLAQISRPDSYNGDARGNILITAQDLFFSPTPASNAVEMVNYTKDHLQSDYKLEEESAKTVSNGHTFATFAYWSPIAGLHWYVMATEIRCHAIEFVFMNRNPKALASTVHEAATMKLPSDANPDGYSGGNGFPACLKDYASGGNLLARVDPFFSEQRFNPVPVRIIIGKDGQVKHIHFLSAFPDQASAITQALRQWKFKPYLQDGKPVEVETGIMFGRKPRTAVPLRHASSPGPRQQTSSRAIDY